MCIICISKVYIYIFFFDKFHVNLYLVNDEQSFYLIMYTLEKCVGIINLAGTQKLRAAIIKITLHFLLLRLLFTS